jgi:hypothetical protein
VQVSGVSAARARQLVGRDGEKWTHREDQGRARLGALDGIDCEKANGVDGIALDAAGRRYVGRAVDDHQIVAGKVRIGRHDATPPGEQIGDLEDWPRFNLLGEPTGPRLCEAGLLRTPD